MTKGLVRVRPTGTSDTCVTSVRTKRYQAAGGRRLDAAGWRRSYGVALVAKGVAQMPFIHGSMRRAMRGEIAPPQIVGVPEAVIRRNLRAGLPMMEQMEQLVIREARRWLG